jgi:phospholipid/cholesterol/gamma-HCH transport system ATP-binding protein
MASSPLPDARKTPLKPKFAIEVRNLVKRFGKRTVLNKINFKLPLGGVLAIMGGSGCGKTTLLRHLIGLVQPDEGEIFIMGREISRLSQNELYELRRSYGMLFQGGALLQSLTVGENVALPILESSRVDEKVASLVVKMKLELVGLTGFEHLKPAQISGGMVKRVALARALALDPDLIFCDEPSAGLDPIMTAVIDKLICDLTEKLGISVAVVTHDMASAFRIASHMIFLFEGQVVAEGSPGEIRQNPDARLQQFINGLPDGPIPLRLSKDDYLKELLGKNSS